MDIPKDPIMLMSFVNTQLRDNFSSLTDLAKSYGVSEDEIVSKLASVGYKLIGLSDEKENNRLYAQRPYYPQPSRLWKRWCS